MARRLVALEGTATSTEDNGPFEGAIVTSIQVDGADDVTFSFDKPIDKTVLGVFTIKKGEGEVTFPPVPVRTIYFRTDSSTSNFRILGYLET